jgi:ATP-dependent Lon protease
VVKPKAIKLKPAQLKWQIDLKKLNFRSTKEVEPLDRIVGQPRAIQAIELGADLRGSRGYNIFVTGLSGTGRMTTVKRMLEKSQRKGNCPELFDYCYVNNFEDESRPKLLQFEKGGASSFSKKMHESITHLLERLTSVFEEDPYTSKRKKVIESYQESEKNLIEDFDEKLKKKGFVRGQIENTKGSPEPDIFILINEKAFKIESLESLVKEKKLTEKQATQIAEDYNKLHEELIELAESANEMVNTFHEEIISFDRKTAETIINASFKDLIKTYRKHLAIQEYLENGKEFILNNIKHFLPSSEQSKNPQSRSKNIDIETQVNDKFTVNIILDNSETVCAPVVIEHNPTYGNLFGSFEKIIDTKGYWRTDFSKVKAGSILQADQGYLIVSANDLFSEAVSWKAIKNVLLYDKLDIQPYATYLQVSESQMKPEPIKVNVKVIIVGGQSLYNYLYRYEKGFKKIFKILAQFDYETAKTDELLDSIVSFIASQCEEENLLHFKPKAVAEVLEWSVAHAGSQDRITLRFSDIADLLREASYFAEQDNKKLVTEVYVKEALKQRNFRNNLIDQKITDHILQGSTLIDTEGSRVGQINGLTVMSTGIASFGKPARITAAIGAGNRGIINIEREAQLSGSIHNKGILIIQGFFLERFAQKNPLSLSASIAFEQNYGGIDGDSASAAEIYVLLSAISHTPITQQIAITGSMNQKGDIQPIGGVNDKITGYYEICKARGFAGNQGVIIPEQNVNDLMLSEDIIESVRKNEFSIHSIKNIEDGSKLLMGKEFGIPDEDGNYKKGTLLYDVHRKLNELYTNSKPAIKSK